MAARKPRAKKPSATDADKQAAAEVTAAQAADAPPRMDDGNLDATLADGSDRRTTLDDLLDSVAVPPQLRGEAF